ncbi:MAG: RtcB family protein [Chloroflexi bacterium]|nr:RtcB family protein [Chloroflexota bacterium]
MLTRSDLKQLTPYLFEIPQDWREDMRVPARVYADEEMLAELFGDRTLEQLANVATLPGIVRHALAMPDAHQGYGFPIGGVAATALPEGAISPGGVGYDINCGVRVLTTTLEAAQIRPKMDEIMSALYTHVPSGVGEGGAVQLTKSELMQVLEEGAEWVVRKGYGTKRDLEHTEEGGRMKAADPEKVGKRALERGSDQIGSLGSGNHFLEVDEIVEVYDERSAEAMGLRKGGVCVWIHCGSRGLGHQICTDAVRTMQSAMKKYGITVPDRELVCAPFNTPEAQEYFAAMCCAANYAWANRQVIAHRVRECFRQVLGKALGGDDLPMLYDVCHNIAKVERHRVNGRDLELCVHRKGATRAFGPGQPEVPAVYRDLGQPVLIPGDMASGSYILVGTNEAMEHTFGSTCHGAGRLMSRAQARKKVRGEQLRQELEKAGITVRAGSMGGLAEEGPHAYKELDRVVEIVHQAGIARKVVRTRPMGVMKG